MRAVKFFLALVMCVTALACGVKAPPRPPGEVLPAKVAGERVQLREGCVELSWKGFAPQAPRPAAGAAARESHAADATVPGDSPRAAGAVARVAASYLPPPPDHYEVLRAKAPAAGDAPVFESAGEARGNEFRDCAVAPDAAYVYTVRAVSADGRRSEAGRNFTVYAAAPPAAPQGLRATGGDRFVELSWKRPAGAEAAAFNVYRGNAPGAPGSRPVNLEPVTVERYVDGPLENDKTYYYEVRAAVPQVQGPPSEGPAAAAQATPVDRVAPSAPQGLIAVWTGKAVELRWFSNPEADLAGYYVYRRPEGQARWQRLNAAPLKENTWRDPSAAPGRAYEYAVTATDSAAQPNESPASVPQRVFTSR